MVNNIVMEVTEVIERETERIKFKLKVVEILLSICVVLQIAILAMLFVGGIMHIGGSAAVASGASVASSQNAMVVKAG